MPDKHQALRELMARTNGEDTDDGFDAYIEWRKTFDIENCKAMLAEIDTLREALERLARLGNGDQYGNSDGNIIAQEALSK